MPPSRGPPALLWTAHSSARNISSSPRARGQPCWTASPLTAASSSHPARRSSRKTSPGDASSSAAAPSAWSSPTSTTPTGRRSRSWESLPRVLPKEDEEVSQALTRSLTAQGIRVLTNTAVEQVQVAGESAHVTLNSPDGALSLEVDRVLVAVGITPNTEGLGAENAGVELDHGFIRVDEWLSANGHGVYAIGDVERQAAARACRPRRSGIRRGTYRRTCPRNR